MSADIETAAELRKWYYGGRQAVHVLERTITVPREPREKMELLSALRLIDRLIEGYKPDSDSR